mmetsp:Transcript_49321/g.127215  ORF Transcript_49321/g.127215 Transcript_49321/m.127215 type:complete len:304 (+) Transcript_49321:116-1027(+)
MRVPDAVPGSPDSQLPTPEDFTPQARLSFLPRKEPSRGSRGLEFLVVALLPWLVFSLIVSLFMLAYRSFPSVVWASVVPCGMLGLLFVAMGGSQGRPPQLAVGLLICIAVAIAVPVGHFVEKEFMADFWRLDAGATYRRLDPLDPSASHTDATLIEFTEGTFVDVQRSLGYMKGGIVYCVAPITRQGANTSRTPEYWAAGEDCCAQRGQFTCGDVEIPGTRSGLAVDDSLGNYKNAVRVAQSAYQMDMAPGPVLAHPVVLRWTASPSDHMDSLLKGAVTFASIACAVHLIGSGCAGMVLTPRF